MAKELRSGGRRETGATRAVNPVCHGNKLTDPCHRLPPAPARLAQNLSDTNSWSKEWIPRLEFWSLSNNIKKKKKPIILSPCELHVLNSKTGELRQQRKVTFFPIMHAPPTPTTHTWPTLACNILLSHSPDEKKWGVFSLIVLFKWLKAEHVCK